MHWHIGNFLKDKNVASFAATRKENVMTMLNDVSFEKHQTIIEFGPGDGAFTEEILRRMSSKSKLIIIESNPEFIHILRDRFQDGRLEILHDCATNLSQILTKKKIKFVDCILTGIPLSFLTKDKQEKLLEDCFASLAEGGNLLIYQALLPRHSAALRRILEKRFDHIEVNKFPFNLPPLFSLNAVKSHYAKQQWQRVKIDRENYSDSETERLFS